MGKKLATQERVELYVRGCNGWIMRNIWGSVRYERGACLCEESTVWRAEVVQRGRGVGEEAQAGKLWGNVDMSVCSRGGLCAFRQGRFMHTHLVGVAVCGCCCWLRVLLLLLLWLSMLLWLCVTCVLAVVLMLVAAACGAAVLACCCCCECCCTVLAVCSSLLFVYGMFGLLLLV